MARKLVVVGNGMAGVRAIEEILARNGELFEITVFGDEPYGNYNRILLSNVLAGSQTVDDEDGIYLNALDWYRENDIDLRAGVRVVRIDRFARLVHADDGTVTRYDNLILAAGSRSFFPPMTGLWADDKTLADGVFGFRSLDDCMGMISQAEHRTKAVVIGGGLLGLEAARGLQNRGLAVDVVHAGATLMNAQLDDSAGAILRRSVEDIGITVHTDKRTTEVRTHDGKLTGIVFSDGTSIDCNMLVIAAGIRPNVGLAQRAGLTVERAIWSTTTCARSTTTPCTWSASARSTGVRSTGWWHRCGSRPASWPTTSPAPTGRRRITGHGRRRSSRSRVWRSRRWASGAGTARRRVRAVLRTQARRLQDHRDP